ncbi:tRNA glutamyl-Q(34) synthetase GluQRS [Litorimonas sp. WD9-15]|uniref:tRNA glutamyl-Q(34) synthetase GluQRS n=1 Tax=Litorimonas sp. WD9-15 TaxID=3418716 RepID=UPI003D0022A0
MTLRTRFAPSPTGQLHLGHARAAFEAFGFAREQGGTCLLRIEDIDHTRCRPDYMRGIYEDLDWLGLDWPLPVRVQSRHIADYMGVVRELVGRGLAYPCTLTRGDIKARKTCGPATSLSFSKDVLMAWGDYSLHGIESAYRLSDETIEILTQCLDNAARRESPTLPFSIRFNLQAALSEVSEQSLTYQEISRRDCVDRVKKVEKQNAFNVLNDWVQSDRPDPIIARRDIATSYDIAVTHDDALQNITHIVRGRDLADQTPLHVLLQTLMGWPTPIYYHHDLVLRENGEKLAKRNLDTALASLREAGQSVAEIKRLAGVTQE